MLDKTLGYILCCQSPGLFLAAAVLVIAYFAGRKKHRFKATLKLLLGIVCAVGGVVLYYMGMYDEYFTIRDFYRIRPAGWVGFGIVAFLTLLALVQAFFAAADARREEKAANRAENQRLAAEAAAAEAAAAGDARADAGGACAVGMTPIQEKKSAVPEGTALFSVFGRLNAHRSRRWAWARDGTACR